MTGHYILKDRKPVKCDDLFDWAMQFEKSERVVKKTNIEDVRVSTVFLGLDCGYDGLPLLFETMIFGGKYDGYQERYSTWDEAEAGHQKAIDLLFQV